MNDLLKVPRTKKGVETLNNILSAATQLIYERGYYGANIADITKLAGVATGTFYTYFDSKISLYRYLLLQFSHRIRKEMSIKTSGCKNRREAEREGLKAWLQFVVKYPYLYNIIWESLYVDRSLFTDYYESFSRAYMKGLDAAKSSGEIREIDSEVLSYTLMGITNFLGLKFGMFSEGPVDMDYVTDEVMKIFDGGMFTGTFAPEKSTRSDEKRDMNFRVEVDFDFLDHSGTSEEAKQEASENSDS